MPVRTSLLVLALVAAACTPVERPPAPLDRFTFPTGLALHGGRLYVLSSNFDLTYESDDGGSILSVDTAAWEAGALSGLRIPSFGGELEVATAAACAGLPADQLLAPNRFTGELYRLTLGEDGALSCGAGCKVELSPPGEGSPFPVEVVCRPGRTPRAYVGWLEPLRGGACGDGLPTSVSCGKVSSVALDGTSTASVSGAVALDRGGIRKLAYDAELDVLYFGTTGSTIGWVDLSGDCTVDGSDEACTVRTVDMSGFAAGTAVRSVAVSSPGQARRLYVVAQLYNPSAASAGVEIVEGGALFVLSMEEAAAGGLQTRHVRTVWLPTGATEVAAIPRAGKRDLLAITAGTAGELWFWDDEIEAVRGVMGRDELGQPAVGSIPYGLVVGATGTGEGTRPVRLYVGSFGDGVVKIVDVDPDAPDPLRSPAGAMVIGSIPE